MDAGTTWLDSQEAVVGIFAENNARDDGPMGNAAPGYLQEKGSPAQSPGSAFSRPPVSQAVKEQVEALMGKAVQACIAGHEGEAERYLDIAGQLAVANVQKVITEGIPPPLKPQSLLGRQQERPPSGRGSGQAAAEGIASRDYVPLLDTEQLFNAITFKVRRRGG